ncbi:hypothetical protein N7492_002692 [Penicillium capsulatum]|uniref:Uncharacterized protein n=1 Tax=Penicillium capsulatum TaxID=69766 RepID=A0A9W9LWP1_9EURO|nr:hypothetical protein N7492_002692 [Penicillium capsulatum]KAJ6122710.1 hypothetical protein N7512_005175 [Penicillium capsulatum]
MCAGEDSAPVAGQQECALAPHSETSARIKCKDSCASGYGPVVQRVLECCSAARFGESRGAGGRECELRNAPVIVVRRRDCNCEKSEIAGGLQCVRMSSRPRTWRSDGDPVGGRAKLAKPACDLSPPNFPSSTIDFSDDIETPYFSWPDTENIVNSSTDFFEKRPRTSSDRNTTTVTQLRAVHQR